MGMYRNRASEVKCPKCGENCKTKGGVLCKYKQKVMHRQYRQCLECGYKVTTFKDPDTKEIWLDGVIINK